MFFVSRMASKQSKRKKKNNSPTQRSFAATLENKPGTPADPGQPTRRAVFVSWIAFVAVLLACAAWALGHAYLVDTVTVRLCNEADRNIPVENRMPVFLSEIAFDGYTWNRHAEKLGEGGQWRVRHTDFDNAPEGREVHWNSAFAWYLRGLGELRRAATGDSLRNSIFRMSIWANPILLVLALAIFSTLSARRFGPLCGTVIAIGMVAVPTFYEGFMPAYPDHHGLIAFALLGMLFGIAWAGVGWVQEPGGADFVPPHSLAQAKHGMIFSAICGAAGLWISALSTAIVLGTVGMAALAVALLFGRAAGKSSEFHPELWKLWALWGAGGSLFFHLLEYFPSDMGMRMEVNHPLYALAWLGGGWIIAILSQWITGAGAAPNPFPWRRLVWPLAACAVLPAVVILGGPSVYIPKDPFLSGLWKNIAELLPLMKRIELGGLTWQMAFGWFPVFILAAVVLLWFRQVGRGTKAALVFLSIPILLITALQLYQVRWGMLAGPLYIALAGIVVPQVWHLVPRDRTGRALAAAMLLAFAYLFIEPSFKNSFSSSWGQFQSGAKTPVSSGQALALLHRQMARTILDNADGKPVVLLSSPNSSCLLSALGGFRTIGTLYWENVEGLKSAAKALNAQSDGEALDLMKKHGVTHVSMMTWENFIEPFFRILYPKPIPGITLDKSFGKRALGDRQIPAWTRPIVFPPNDLTKALAQQVLMLRVVPEQSAVDAKFHMARYVRFVEDNPVLAEISLREILDVSPGDVRTRLELVRFKLDQKSYDEAVVQMLPALPAMPQESRAEAIASLSDILKNAGRADLVDRLQHWDRPPEPPAPAEASATPAPSASPEPIGDSTQEEKKLRQNKSAGSNPPKASANKPPKSPKK
jgi:hypothetical protein